MEVFLRLALVAISVGLADSLTPETVGPALYLATGRKPVRRVAEFTAGVLAVHFTAGVILVSGPGGWLFRLVPRPHGQTRDAVELAAGAVLLLCAAALWLLRKRLTRRPLPTPSGPSALAAGASIAALGLPTAIPYLALLAAVIASSVTLPQQIGVVALYNLCFVSPLLGIVIVLVVAGKRAELPLAKSRSWLQDQWPVVIAGLLLVVGGVLVLLGGAGLVRS
jgi:cytochrome c biogenesis protein CcdA